VIVQAALAHESWFGYADVLVRTNTPSKLGRWSYEVIDTKLARETRAGTILQLGLYSAMLAEIQGQTPEQFHVVVPGLGGSEQVKIPFRVDDYSAYFRLMQHDLLDAAAIDPDELAELYYPEPVDLCDLCNWSRVCDAKRHADDHLSLVAFLGRLHRRELESNNITTLEKLARLTMPIAFKPKRGSRETYERAHHQALVQLESRGQSKPLFNLRPPEPVVVGAAPEPPRGLSRLPAPSPGDVFLDLEGDMFADEGGREYLFGIVTPQRGDYQKWWAFTAHEERVAFESVMDFIIRRLDVYPDMHVYHYAPYEPSAFKRLMGRHATREAELDRLLRGGRFIDLYGVVRQGLWVGVESYSIKQWSRSTSSRAIPTCETQAPHSGGWNTRCSSASRRSSSMRIGTRSPVTTRTIACRRFGCVTGWRSCVARRLRKGFHARARPRSQINHRTGSPRGTWRFASFGIGCWTMFQTSSKRGITSSRHGGSWHTCSTTTGVRRRRPGGSTSGYATCRLTSCWTRERQLLD
jgi:predicted RecB family nuclease